MYLSHFHPRPQKHIIADGKQGVLLPLRFLRVIFLVLAMLCLPYEAIKTCTRIPICRNENGIYAFLDFVCKYVKIFFEAFISNNKWLRNVIDGFMGFSFTDSV